MCATRTCVAVLLTLAAVYGLAGFAAPADDSVPVGTIMAWAGEKGSVPANWMICDGKALKINQYKNLYDAIGRSWGKPGNKKFSLPDLRGRFMRGVDDGAGLDPDTDDRDASNKGGNNKGVGSVQDDAVQEHAHYQLEHSHLYYRPYASVKVIPAGAQQVFIYGVSQRTTDSVAPAISGAIKYKNRAAVKLSDETRPKNANVYFIIKVK